VLFDLTKTEVINVRVPDDLILELDSLVKKRLFKSRSEAIREFAREYVRKEEHVQEQNAKVSGRGGGRW
jgi:metal-responsive CopG/Arc/MetJ family transcriptional regulator